MCFSETMSQNLSQTSQKSRKYPEGMRAAIPWTPRLRNVNDREIFFKLYRDKEKRKFISLEDYFALLLELYSCNF